MFVALSCIIISPLPHNSPHHTADGFAVQRLAVNDVVQRHPFNKRIERAGGRRVEPGFERLLAAAHPVLHDDFKLRLAARVGVELVHQLHIFRRRHLRAANQRR